MGGTTFETTGMDPDVGKAFHIAREQAGYEHGHGGYSGTIQEKHDFVVITNTPVPYAVAEVQAGTLIDADDPRIRDKWGPAGAIPFFNTNTEGNTKTHTLKFNLPGGLQYDEKNAAIEAEVAKLKLSGDVIGTRIVSDTPAPARVKAEATKGKTVTKFIVTGTITRREDGSPLVRVTRTVPKRALVVEVSVLKASILNKVQPDGWLFFGWASC
jgi:hypothetical protein